MRMQILIPTRGRTLKQQTLEGLPPEILQRTWLFCPEAESGHLARRWLDKGVQISAQPDPDMRIAAKRAWMLKTAWQRGAEKVLMLDDDLFFYVRREDKPDRLRDANHSDIIRWFGELEERLTPETPHGGYGPRQGNHNFPAGWLSPGRMMLALGYHVPTVLKEAVLDRIGTREDMDVALQLLSKGLPNVITHEMAVGQKTYAAPGGCTDERTTASSDADAELLAELHPGLVRVVAKEYKGHPRKEVVVSWKRALEAGLRARAQRS